MTEPSPERLSLPVDAPGIDRVGALWHPGGSDRPAVLLANGAGFHMEAPWMASLARRLVARGFPVLRFNYPYRERALARGTPLPPDPAPVLEAAHERALEALLARTDGNRPILAGKSLGGRMSTLLAAKDLPCAALVLYGYPLHPPERPEKRRHEHFPAVVQPALFLQGTRDALCDLALLGESLATWGGSARVHVIEGADHGFSVPKRTGRTQDDVLDELAATTSDWVRETLED